MGSTKEMQPTHTRAAVRSNVTYSAIERFVRRQRWRLHDAVRPRGDIPLEIIWLTEDGETAVHYVDDELLSVRYFLLEGARQAETLAEIRSEIDLWGRSELLAQLDQATTPAAIQRVLYQISVSAPATYDAEVFAALHKGWKHETAEVRYATIGAIEFLAWEELRPVLERLQVDDPDLAIREVAGAVLGSLSRYVWQTSQGNE